jgi:hypothetical protein
MKPTTPEQFANCYGTFIADLVIVAKVLPALTTWLQTSLPDVNNVYKLNPALFTGSIASVTSFPGPIREKFPTRQEANRYNTSKNNAWTAMTIDLKNALTCAKVDPTLAASILASFGRLKPADNKNGGK